jgi:tRNA pseudouridine38-40 synthase
MNFKLLIQYDGTNYHGWQIQANVQPTVQGVLERVIGKLENGKVSVAGSGRTDAGVHAAGQVANVHLTKPFTAERLRHAINGNLPRDLRIIEVEQVGDDFHARFSAVAKTYSYRVVNARVISPFHRLYAHHESRPLNVASVREAARLFIGEHDWTAFSSAHSDSVHKIRTIKEFSIETFSKEHQDGTVIEFSVTGSGFLRYMVRSMVGTLLEVGRGERDSATIQTAIDGGDRSLAGKTAPAHGLTLVSVSY